MCTALINRFINEIDTSKNDGCGFFVLHLNTRKSFHTQCTQLNNTPHVHNPSKRHVMQNTGIRADASCGCSEARLTVEHVINSCPDTKCRSIAQTEHRYNIKLSSSNRIRANCLFEYPISLHDAKPDDKVHRHL